MLAVLDLFVCVFFTDISSSIYFLVLIFLVKSKTKGRDKLLPKVHVREIIGDYNRINFERLF